MKAPTAVRPSPAPVATLRPLRRRRWTALVAVVPVLVAGGGLWWLLHDDPPAAVNLDGVGAPATSATTANGTWTVDRTIVSAEGTGSFAGFRIDGVPARTTSVAGTVTVTGTAVTAAHISADLTDVTTNDPPRDSAVRPALDTSHFPDATFVLTDPIQVGALPAGGERITVPATGDLTVHGVTRQVTVDLQVQLQGGVLVVVGSAPVTLADYGVIAPTAPVVASVDDHGTFEFQLYLTRS